MTSFLMASLRSVISPLSRLSSIPLISSMVRKATPEIQMEEKSENDLNQDVVSDSNREGSVEEKIRMSDVAVSEEKIRQARHVVRALKEARSASARLHRLEAFIDHVSRLPETRQIMMKEGVISVLLSLREKSKDKTISGCARQGLAMMGYHDPCRGRGIRILSIDGGGSRGVVAIETLRAIERATGKQIYELFDLICGTSTGAILAFMLSFRYLPLHTCEDMYRSLSLETFKQNSVVGHGKLFMNQSYYDTNAWEMMLRENCGDHEAMIQTARDPRTPKVLGVSSLTNRPVLRPYLFRNYDYLPGTPSCYPGSYTYKLWEALRAATAAPGYFSECVLEGNVFSDGGMLTNNPSAVALHEAKLLWGRQTPIQCVISLGNGMRPERDPETKGKSWWLKNWQEKLTQLIVSATDTEAVDTVLRDLLPAGVYFRFNPTLSESIPLDENRVEKLDMMQRDTVTYLDNNEILLQRAASKLLQPRQRSKKVLDWVTLKKAMY